MADNDIERRYVPMAAEPIELEERSAADPVIKGYSPPFNAQSVDLGGFREVFAPSAFDRLIGRHRNDPRGGIDVVALFNHDSSMLLGRTTAGTLDLQVRDKGLAYTITPPDTQLGRDTVTLLRRGDLSGASFAFSVAPGGEQWGRLEDGSQIRTITDVGQLYDVSVVTNPAYPQSTAALRSLEKWKAANLTDAEQRRDAERAADEAADRRRRWGYSLTAAALRLLKLKAKAGHAPRIQ